MRDPPPSTDPRPASASPASPAVFPGPRQLFFLLVAYFVLQVALRTAFSSSVDLDESEQVVLAQQFCFGYGSDPPLYTWLQMPFFWILGESVLALSLFKNLLLFCVYWLTFATARLLTRSTAAAIAAAFSLFYLPGLAWEAQRDLTHTILSVTLALGTLYCLLQLLEQRRTCWYLLLGLSAGLGLLSKYNYALWLLGLLLAAVSMPALRPALRDWRLAAALVLVGVLFLPNALWMLAHPDLALLTSSKFDVRQGHGWFAVAGLGCKHLLESILSFGGPLALIYALLFFKAPARGLDPGETARTYRTLIVRAWLIIAVTLLGLVLFAHATSFRERWFQPILIALPIVAAAFVQNRLDAVRLKVIATISLLVMLGVAIIMPGRLLAAERLKREEPLTRPYAALAAQIRTVIPAGALVVCDTRLLAGNLRLGLPQARVLPPVLTPLMGGDRAHCFLVWDATRNAALPPDLREWALTTARRELPASAAQFFSAPYRYHHGKQYRLGLLQLY